MFCFCLYFFFNDTATTEIYTLSLHDALPISRARCSTCRQRRLGCHSLKGRACSRFRTRDRKSTRLNSSHTVISYAVFCLKKKKKKNKISIEHHKTTLHKATNSMQHHQHTQQE